MTKNNDREYNQVLVALSATWIILIIAMLAVCLVVSRGVSDKAAECASLGGVYSNESDACYYAGEKTTASDIKEKVGL